MNRSAWGGFGFTLPALLWILLFFVGPVLLMVAASLHPLTASGVPSPHLGFGAYRAFFSQPAYVQALIDSVLTTVSVTVLSTVISYPFAWSIACVVPARWQRLALIMAILPFWTSYVVRSYAWLLAISPVGLVNKALLAVHLIQRPLMLAYNPHATELGFVHFFLMLNTLTIYASLKQINPRYELAARDLGASSWRAFFGITLPLSLPGVATGAFLTIVLTIGDYVTPQILGGFRQLLLPQLIMMQIQRQLDLASASAMSLILTAIVALAYLGLQRWLRLSRL